MDATPMVIPLRVYEDIEAGHDYLVKVFGFTSGGVQRLDDRTVVHGEVPLGDSSLWPHAVAPRYASHGGLEVVVSDVDDYHTRAKAAGARIDSEPTDLPYGLREYGPAPRRTSVVVLQPAGVTFKRRRRPSR
jgi:uncharacterized glyoxalase superfamily protein PhnB